MVIGEAVDEAERDEARGGEDSRLVEGRAAQALDVTARAPDHRRLAREHRADRSAEALVEAEGDGVGGCRQLRERHAERDRGVRQPGAVEVHPLGLGAEQGRSGRVEDRTPVPRPRVLEAEDRRRLAERDRHKPGHVGEPAALVDEDVGVRGDRDPLAGPRQGQQRGEVRKRARGHEDRRVLPEQRRRAALELVHRLVLAGGGPAERR